MSTSVNKSLLACLLALPERIRTQPQRDVSWLHRLPYHPYQVLAQRLQIRLVSQLGREVFQGLSGIILPPIKVAIYEGLDAPPQRGEKRSDQEGGGHHREGGLLTGEQDEEPLQKYNANEVQSHKYGTKRAVDEGAVYDHVYVV